MRCARSPIAAPPATALARLGDVFALGMKDGSIQLTAREGADVTEVVFERPPSALVSGGKVVSIVAGPSRTLVAGYDKGFVGVWDTRTGKLMQYQLLHGAPVHLVYADNHVYAASLVGDHTTMDLSVYEQDDCDLVREVWARVPVVWGNGKPEKEPPSSEHRCARGTR